MSNKTALTSMAAAWAVFTAVVACCVAIMVAIFGVTNPVLATCIFSFPVASSVARIITGKSPADFLYRKD